MCECCENGHPTGGNLEAGDEARACSAQLAESLRDDIRSVANGGDEWLDRFGDDVDRVLNELVRRAGT